MRKLVFLRTKYFRDFLTTGAFDAIDDEELFFFGEGEAKPPLSEHPRFVGCVEPPSRQRTKAYSEIRELLLASYRFRSRTSRIKLKQRPVPERVRVTVKAAPGLRQRRIARLLREHGTRSDIKAVIEDVGADLVITPSSGVDTTEVDVARAAREAGVPSLGMMYNWDNLSSKSAFAMPPDYLAVIGAQGAEHATRIHGIPPERVAVLGSPYIDAHFRHEPGSAPRPFPFRYVLFAGCYQPFDELTAIRRLDRAIDEQGLDLKIVYLPHPRRLRRRRPDFIDEQDFGNVVVEPRVRDAYRATWRDGAQPEGGGLPTDAYPALLESAEFVVCPLSTIMLEAAILGRRVLVIGYHDGIHRTSPGTAIKYLHFDKVEDVETFSVCRRERDLEQLFIDLVRSGEPAGRPPKEQLDYWIYHDERLFSDRLADLVAKIGVREGRDAVRPEEGSDAVSAAQ